MINKEWIIWVIMPLWVLSLMGGAVIIVRGMIEALAWLLL